MPRGGFGHFAPDFVYRYVKAPDQSGRGLIDAPTLSTTALSRSTELHRANRRRDERHSSQMGMRRVHRLSPRAKLDTVS